MRSRQPSAGSRNASVPRLASDQVGWLEIRDRGRKVVNLRLPMAVARLALDRVPGLSPDDAARVREALESGMQGAIIDIDDDAGDGVRIVAE